MVHINKNAEAKILNPNRRSATHRLAATMFALGVLATSCSYDSPSSAVSASGNYNLDNYNTATNEYRVGDIIISCTGSAADGPRGNDGRLRVDEKTGQAYIDVHASDSVASLVGRYVEWNEDISYLTIAGAVAAENSLKKIGTLPENMHFVLPKYCDARSE